MALSVTVSADSGLPVAAVPAGGPPGSACRKSPSVRDPALARLRVDLRDERLGQSDGNDLHGFGRIADLVGSVDDRLRADLSARKKHYLKTTGYGRKRPR